MPLYNTATTAAALGVTAKWLDNLLSHNEIDGLYPEAQGVARRLSLASVTQIALAKDLIDELAMPARAALQAASRILREPGGNLILSPLLDVRVSPTELRAYVLDRLSDAVEMAPSPRRGRPPKR